MCSSDLQRPEDLLSEMLCDADLDYLGTDNFYVNAFKLYREWSELGNVMNLKQWFELQIKFLSNHQYFTKTAIKLREKQKKHHLEQIKLLFC